MYQNNAHAQRVEQRDIVNNMSEIGVANGLAGQGDNEGLAPVSINIGRSFTKKFNVVSHGLGFLNTEQQISSEYNKCCTRWESVLAHILSCL